VSAQKLGQLQPSVAVRPPERRGQLTSFGTVLISIVDDRIQTTVAKRQTIEDSFLAHGKRERPQGKIHRVNPDFGSTLTASDRDSKSNCWVNWKIMGQPCEFQVGGAARTVAKAAGHCGSVYAGSLP
jgi:hypothetical protein